MPYINVVINNALKPDMKKVVPFHVCLTLLTYKECTVCKA